MKLVNLYGAPCTGKSTLAYELVGKLRRLGVRAEHVRDTAREDVLWASWGKLKDPLYQFSRVQHAINMVRGVADVVIVECPLLLSLAYMPEGEPELSALVKAYHKREDNLDFFLERNPAFAYDPVGRDCGFVEATARGERIRQVLKECSPHHASGIGGDDVADEVMRLLGYEPKARTRAALKAKLGSRP